METTRQGLPVRKSAEGLQPLWTVEDVAAYLRKSSRWVWSAVRRSDDMAGSIPHCRVGRSPRFDPGEISAWARANCPNVATWKSWKALGRGGNPGGGESMRA